jgi:hypothetical protein
MLYQLHITLSEVYTPNVWRRVTVPSQFTFLKLHKVIQKAFGWKDYHLFQFMDIDRSLMAPERFPRSFDIGIPHPEDDVPVTDAKRIKISEVIPESKKLKYIYDFGDYWEHVITLEKIDSADSKHASLLGGEGACPPEDCGGPTGYEHVKVVLANPAHEEHEDIRTWVGLKKKLQWKSDHFDLEKTAPRIEKV